jgi:hypothetical protein
MFDRRAVSKLVGPAPDFEVFHRGELAYQASGERGVLAGRAARELAPFCFIDASGLAFSYVSSADGLTILEGRHPEASPVVRGSSNEVWSDYAQGIRSISAFLYTGDVCFEAGSLEDYRDWHPALQALYHGTPVYEPSSIDFRSSTGEALDLNRRFRRDDDPAELREFMAQAGFAVVRDVFEGGEIAGLIEEAERVATLAEAGAANGWCAPDPSGRSSCYRLHYAGDESESIQALFDDTRIRALVAATGQNVAPVRDRMDGVIGILKRFGVEEGLANLPWHYDCGYGGHRFLCPSVMVGVQLDAANESSGMLHFVAGSHRATLREPTPEMIPTLPIVALETNPGDVTLHIADAFHAAPAPTDPHRPRRSLYPQFFGPATFEVVPAGESYYTDKMPGYGEGEIASVEELTQVGS